MAYNVLYYNEIPNSLVYGNLTRIEILERDYAGAPINLNKRIGATISFGNNGDGREDPIKKKTATISLFSQRSLEFEHLFTSDDRKYQVKVYYDTDLVFIGFLESDSYEEPYSFYENYEVVLTARDNLGRLEDVDYLDGNGDRYKGLSDVDVILNRVLNSTGLNLLISDNIQIYASGQNESLNTTSQSKINNFGFWNEGSNEPISRYEVLERILKGYGAQIRQVGEFWEITEQARYFNNPTVNIDDIKPRFLQDSINMDVTPNDAYWRDQSANLALQPAWKSFSIKQDFLFNEKIFPYPSDDSEYTQLTPIFADINNWTQDSSIEIYHTVNAGIFAIRPKQAADPSYKMYRDVDVKATTNTVLFQIDFGLANRARLLDPEPTLVSEGGTDCDLFFDIINTSSSGDQILTTSGWVAYTSQERELTFSGVSTGELSILIDGIPNDGQLRIVLWNTSDGKFITPGGGVLTWGIAYNDIKLTFNTGSKLSELTAQINESNNIVDKFDFKIGQVPNVNNSQIVYLGGLFDANGNALINWGRKGELFRRNLLQVVAEGYDLLNNRVSRQITGSIHGWKWDFNTNIKDQGRTMMINSGTWDLVNDTLLDAEFIEVFEYKNTYGAFDDGFDDGFENSDSADYKTNTIFTLTEKFE